ncbi:MAG: phosphotransferase [Microlunatus sp.]|nr:phosphotransferase [Microlunatus sp.]
MKVAADPETAAALRVEWRIYSQLAAAYLPEVLGWDDDGSNSPMLILEDLAAGTWPPPWRTGQVREVLEMLDQVAATEPPVDLPSLESLRRDMVGWTRVAASPMAFLGLGFCSPGWLDRTLPTLLDAEADVSFGGESLVHGDVRGPNVCFTKDRVLLLDWSNACVGNPLLDVAFWLTNLCADGGPVPDDVAPGAGQAAAVVSGFFARRAEELGAQQRRYLRIALDWSARALDLPAPGPLTP